jgi:hypothetical protein
MLAQGRRPTALDRAQRATLRDAQPGMLCAKAIALRADDVGHFHRGPAHD